MGPSHFATTEYSQKQLMGKFSVHHSTVESQQQSHDHVLGNSNTTPDASHSIDQAIKSNATCNSFMQPRSFDMNFLSHEPDVINDYLIGAFPAMSYQDAMTQGPLNGSGFGTGPQTRGTFSSHNSTPSVLAQVNGQTGQLQVCNEQPPAVDYREDVVGAVYRASTKVDGSQDAMDDIVPANPWAIPSAAYERLTSVVSNHKHVLPTPFILPSRQRMSMFVASWIRGFHPHLPFVHLPTTSLDSMTPMLLLTLAATGAFYGFEHTSGYAMYFLAKSIINEELEKRRRIGTLELLQTFPQYAEFPMSSSRRTFASPPKSPVPVDTELLQALLVLILTMSWLDEPLAKDALAMSSQLAALTREALASPPEQTINNNWVEWAHEETRRRTLLSAYFVLNIQTICFNVPPQITSQEISLTLPCCEAKFTAPNAEAWRHLHHNDSTRLSQFQHCLNLLLSGKPIERQESVTEFGNYMLVQSLLMQIYCERQAASTLPASLSFSSDSMARYTAALGAWQSCWDTSIEPAIDPSTSSYGPLAFNSTAILRLAHIHLATGLQSHTALLTREPRIIAKAFEPHRNPISLGSPYLDQVVLHAIRGLRIPVRVGIAFVARGRTGHWSVQHAISNFACALLLTHWLERIYCLVSADGLGGLRSEEQRLLSALERLIEETHLEGSLGPKDIYPRRIRRLAAAAIRLWAETFTGIQVFEIVHVIGETLSLVAASIESQ